MIFTENCQISSEVLGFLFCRTSGQKPYISTLSHEKLKVANDIIVNASKDTGACYGVKKCAEIVYDRGKMVKGEGLDVLNERMEALDPGKSDVYKFLGCEQGERIDVLKVFKRVTDEIIKRMKSLVELELYEKNLIKAINCRVIPVAGYVMNVC